MISRTRIFLALLATAAIAVLTLFSVPAAAHDQLVSSNPENGAQLDKQPEWLELEFSGDVQQMGNEIKVMFGDQDVSAGEITVEGRTVKSALPDDLQNGEYTVVWRVVSQDGHPIDGKFSFTIKDDSAAGGAASEASSEAPGLGAAASDNAGETPQKRGELADSDTQNASANGLSMPMMILIGVGVLALVVIVILLLNRKAKGLPGTRDEE